MHARLCACYACMRACVHPHVCVGARMCVLCMFTFVQIPVCVHEYVCRDPRFLSAVFFNHSSLDMYEAESHLNPELTSSASLLQGSLHRKDPLSLPPVCWDYR